MANFEFRPRVDLSAISEARSTMDAFCRKIQNGDDSMLYDANDPTDGYYEKDDRSDRKYREDNRNRNQKKEFVRPKRTFGDGTPVVVNDDVQDVRMSEPKLIHKDELKFMDDFLEEYSSEEVKTSYAKQRQLIYEVTIPLCKILSNYFNPKFEDIQGTMDTVLQIMTR